MANWQEKFKCWELQLKNSTDESTSKCVQEIIRTTEAISKSDGRATLACKVLNLVCRVLNINAGVELFTTLSKFIFDKFWATFTNSLKYFMAVLISKKMWNEAIAMLPIIENCDLNETTHKDLLYFHSTCHVALVIYKQVPESNFKSCSKQLTEVLSSVRRKNPNEYFDLIYELLGSNRNFQILMLKLLEGSEPFLNSIASDLAKCVSLNNVCDLIEKVSAITIFLTYVDVRNKSKYALLFLRAFMSAIKNNENQNDANILSKLCMLISYLIKILIEKETKKFNTHFIDILDKLRRLMQMGKPDEPWNSSGCYLVCNILLRNSSVIREKLDSENLDPMYKLMETLSAIVERNDNLSSHCSKTYCLECEKLIEHVHWSLINLQAIILRQSMQLSITNEKYEELYLKILNRVLDSYSETTCSEMKACIQNAFRESYSIIKHSIQSKTCANFALKCLNVWHKTSIARAQITDMQVVYLYKHLLNLKGSHREALEMHCLYIVHLMASQDSKQNSISDEIALCSAAYMDAKVDYEQSICDILDKAKVNLPIPPFDHKSLRRLQLHVSTKYAGIDSKLKNHLAKKVFEETDDEVELSEILTIIGKISFPEMQSKVESSIKSLKRKLLYDKRDAYKSLALARLLLRQYKFKLEKIKADVTVRSFNEAILHGMDINYFKILNVCSENQILENLIGAKDHFVNFYNSDNFDENNKNWDQIIDDISSLARHFTLRGYLDESLECWLLIYRIAKKFRLVLSEIRAISFFADHSEIIQESKSIDLNSAINDVSGELLSYYKKLEKQSPRQQNYILLAIINIASYYLRQNKLENSQLLINLACTGRNKLADRKDSTDLVSISILAYNFKMLTESSRKDVMVASTYFYLHSIMDAIASVKLLTSEDSINLPTFLFRLVVDLAHFTLYRLCASSIRPFLYSLLQCVAEFSLSFRLAQIVSVLASVDLQMERTDSCHTKLIILDTLLNKTSHSQSMKAVNRQIEKPKSKFLTSHIVDVYDLAIEPARRVPLSPKNIKQPYLSFNQATTSDYLLDHANDCTCDMCSNPLFKFISFQVGCLHARSHYLNCNLSSCETFYQHALNWWKSNLQTSPTVKYYSFYSIFDLFIYYVNTLRQSNMLAHVMTVIEEAKVFLKQYGKQEDPTYMHILVESEIAAVCMAKTVAKQQSRLSPNLHVDANIETPIRPVTSRNKRLDIIISKRTAKTESITSSSSDDADVVTNLISDWKISEIENKENSPALENKLATKITKSTITKRTGKVAKIKPIARTTSVSSSTSSKKENDESQPLQKSGRKNYAGTTSSRSKVKESETKTIVRTRGGSDAKSSELLGPASNSRTRRNRC